jgi:hypothetical protein
MKIFHSTSIAFLFIASSVQAGTISGLSNGALQTITSASARDNPNPTIVDNDLNVGPETVQASGQTSQQDHASASAAPFGLGAGSVVA